MTLALTILAAASSVGSVAIICATYWPEIIEALNLKRLP
jgi:hypothetical protein